MEEHICPLQGDRTNINPVRDFNTMNGSNVILQNISVESLEENLAEFTFKTETDIEEGKKVYKIPLSIKKDTGISFSEEEGIKIIPFEGTLTPYIYTDKIFLNQIKKEFKKILSFK